MGRKAKRGNGCVLMVLDARQTVAKKTFINIMLWILPAVWCCIISQFSLQSAVVSADLSSGFAAKVAEIVCKTAESIPGFKIEFSFSYIHHLVRKAAHFCIFTVLGFWFSIRCKSLEAEGKLRIAAAVLTAGLCMAIADECTQYFVPGRSMQVKDVMIDFSGVIAGHNSFCLLLSLLNMEKKSENK